MAKCHYRSMRNATSIWLLGATSLVLTILGACGGDGGSRDDAKGGTASTAAGTSSSAAGSNAATAGSSSSSSSSGGGATVMSKCGAGPFPIGDGTANLIDDLEDGNKEITSIDGRSSAWFYESDGTATGTMSPPPASLLPAEGGAEGTAQAIHVNGDGFTKWGVTLGTGLNENMGLRCPYDASAYGGISFYAKGGGKIRFALAESAIYPAGLGGTCVSPGDAECFSAHGVELTLTSEWKLYNVAWADVKQGNWGLQAAFDPKTIMLVQFSASNDNMPFDFWIDELSFLEAGAKGNLTGGGSGGSSAGGSGGSGNNGGAGVEGGATQ